MVWWADAMRCYCFSRNILDQIHTPDDDWISTPYELRYGQTFRGSVIPFGCHVEYIPNDDKEKALQHTFDTTTVSGIFMGYRQRPGGYWSGEYLILPFSSIENAVSHQAMQLRKVPDVVTSTKLAFPLKEGIIKFGTLPDAYKMPTQVWELGYEEEDAVVEDSLELPPRADDYIADGCEADQDRDTWEFSGLCLTRRHRIPRTRLFTPNEVADFDPCPLPLEWLDIVRDTMTDSNAFGMYGSVMMKMMPSYHNNGLGRPNLQSYIQNQLLVTKEFLANWLRQDPTPKDQRIVQ